MLKNASYKTFYKNYSSLTFLNELTARTEQNKYETDLLITELPGTGKRIKMRGYIWGGGQYGALGSEKLLRPPNEGKAKLYIKAPMQMHFTQKFEINKVSCGYGFTIFASNSMLYGCGLNNYSQIGYHEARKNSGNSLEFVLEPVPIKIPFKTKSHQILKISAGQNHCAILTSEGIYTFGKNEFGQCGRKVIPDENYKDNPIIHFINQSDLPPINDVVCSDNTTYLITKSGVYAFGQGTYGQIGNGTYNSINSEPSLVDTHTNCGMGLDSDDHVVKLSSRSTTILALTKKGRVIGWGSGEHGQFSGLNIFKDTTKLSNPDNISTPVPLDDLLSTALRLKNAKENMDKSKDRIIPIDVACTHTACALVDKHSGSVYVWGMGILGKGPSLSHSSYPSLIPKTIFFHNVTSQNVLEKNEDRVTKVYGGYSHFAALTSNGGLHTWGQNRVGTLGLGHTNPQYFPYRVVLMCSEISQVSLGYDHTAIISKTLV